MVTKAQKNDKRLDDLMSEVRELGRDAASGKDSLPSLAHKIVRAANDGIVTLDKDSEGKDDAHRVYDAYLTAESKKAVHDHTATGKKANVSKLRQLIAVGGMTTCDPVEVFTRASRLYQEMVKSEVKVVSPYPALVAVARAQLACDTDLTDDQIRAACEKVSKDKTLETELTRIVNSIEKIVTGEAGVQDQSDELVQAHSLVKQRLAALMSVKERDEVLAKAASLGLTVVENTPATEQPGEQQAEAA
ncbi:MAG TPA: hypothetical protein VKT73_15250 [Xanthobacteraceae bacterium]|nr:hypothetical protein [Xanthobacteraceae bacterium]